MIVDLLVWTLLLEFNLEEWYRWVRSCDLANMVYSQIPGRSIPIIRPISLGRITPCRTLKVESPRERTPFLSKERILHGKGGWLSTPPPKILSTVDSEFFLNSRDRPAIEDAPTHANWMLLCAYVCVSCDRLIP